MKKIILAMMIIVLVACQKQTTYENKFDIINQTLDIMTMIEFDELLYLATNEGLYTMDKKGQISSVELIQSLSIIHTLFVGEDHNLYVGGMNGLLVIEPNKTQKYYDSKMEWLPDIRVLSVHGDDKGTLYIGTFGGLGILNLETMTGTVMTEEDGLLVPMVNVITTTRDGSLWLASYNVRAGGITRIKEDNITYYKDNLASIHITSFLYEDDKLYFGGGVYDAGGMTEFVYKDSDWTIKKLWYYEDGFAGAKVRSLFMQDQQLFIGSEYNGLAKWEDDAKTIYTVQNGLPNDEVKSIIVYKNELYIGTRSGLAKWKK